MTRGLRLAALASTLSVAAACTMNAGSSATRPAPPPTTAQGAPGMGGAGGVHGTGATGMHGMEGMCPMHIEGAHVAVEDTARGVAMVFTTTTGDVAGLRARVRHMAAMVGAHGEHMGPGHGMHGGPHGPGAGAGDTGGGMMGMVPSEARVVDIEGGARLELTPRDPADLTALRSNARTHAERMAGGHCPMMHEGSSTSG